jgi:MFS transporter, DHA1 family, inner membrane transport protein
MALLGLASFPVLLAVPPRLAPPRPGSDLPAPVGLAAWVALAGCGAYLVGIVAVWAYFGVWEHQLGMPPQLIGTTAALSLGAQVLGAGVVGLLAPRLRIRTALLLATALQVAVVFGLLRFDALHAQVALALAFGFLWLFTIPLQTRLLIDVDPSRRAVLNLAAAQLTGSAAGPTLASLFVTAGRVDGALWTGVAVLAVSALMVGVATRNRS